MTSDRHSVSRHERIATGSVVLILVLVLAALTMAPATALGQATGPATTTPTATLATTPQAPRYTQHLAVLGQTISTWEAPPPHRFPRTYRACKD